jgi:hypothetical protein
VEGYIHAKALQNPLMLDCGHETPLKNTRISDININITIPVSLFGIKTDTVIEKNIVARRNGIISIITSNGMPI